MELLGKELYELHFGGNEVEIITKPFILFTSLSFAPKPGKRISRFVSRRDECCSKVSTNLAYISAKSPSKSREPILEVVRDTLGSSQVPR